MLVLGIETSCDETAIGIVEDGFRIRASRVASQLELHRVWGGVVPEIASRQHLRLINILLKEACQDAQVSFSEIDAIAATCGPGLVGSLLVGLSTAKAYAYVFNKPFIGINHLEGHLLALVVENKPEEVFPLVGLIVSGGHTALVLGEKIGQYKLLGQTLDDAAGEVFDKISKFLNLGYPGGPIIDKLSSLGDVSQIHYPRAYLKNLKKCNFDFSFSGLKTAVINYVKTHRKVASATIVASFQKAVVDVLVKKTLAAAQASKVKNIGIVGGVACNRLLRAELNQAAQAKGLKVFTPPPNLCTDNGVMIAVAGYFRIKAGKRSPLSLNAFPDLGIEDEV